jgi:hypothetical protein
MGALETYCLDKVEAAFSVAKTFDIAGLQTAAQVMKC